jgi:hypothetical protein
LKLQIPTKLIRESSDPFYDLNYQIAHNEYVWEILSENFHISELIFECSAPQLFFVESVSEFLAPSKKSPLKDFEALTNQRFEECNDQYRRFNTKRNILLVHTNTSLSVVYISGLAENNPCETFGLPYIVIPGVHQKFFVANLKNFVDSIKE